MTDTSKNKLMLPTRRRKQNGHSVFVGDYTAHVIYIFTRGFSILLFSRAYGRLRNWPREHIIHFLLFYKCDPCACAPLQQPRPERRMPFNKGAILTTWHTHHLAKLQHQHTYFQAVGTHSQTFFICRNSVWSKSGFV